LPPRCQAVAKTAKEMKKSKRVQAQTTGLQIADSRCKTRVAFRRPGPLRRNAPLLLVRSDCILALGPPSHPESKGPGEVAALPSGPAALLFLERPDRRGESRSTIAKLPEAPIGRQQMTHQRPFLSHGGPNALPSNGGFRPRGTPEKRGVTSFFSSKGPSLSTTC
jgi:hypothetical protein